MKVNELLELIKKEQEVAIMMGDTRLMGATAEELLNRKLNDDMKIKYINKGIDGVLYVTI